MSDIVKVRPVKVAEFKATQWTGDREAIDDLAHQYGWRVKALTGLTEAMLMIYGRNGKRYPVRKGEWVIALGTNGSLRVCTDKMFRRDYREVTE